MANRLVPIVIGVVVGGGVMAAIAYHVARFLRGSIKLSLSRTAFNPGETIKGSLSLGTKKAILGNKLIVSLIGVERTTTHRDGKSHTNTREIYRDEILVENARAYPAGYTAAYQFEIAVPKGGSPMFLNSPLGQTIASAVNLFRDRRTQLVWRIEARLDAQGVDLATSKQVSINTPQAL
jgi:hypothetical protein